jgi:hypothetical protein
MSQPESPIIGKPVPLGAISGPMPGAQAHSTTFKFMLHLHRESMQVSLPSLFVMVMELASVCNVTHMVPVKEGGNCNEYGGPIACSWAI